MTTKRKSHQSYLKHVDFRNSLNLDTREACSALGNVFETNQSLIVFPYEFNVGKYQPVCSLISKKKIDGKEVPDELVFHDRVTKVVYYRIETQQADRVKENMLALLNEAKRQR